MENMQFLLEQLSLSTDMSFVLFGYDGNIKFNISLSKSDVKSETNPFLYDSSIWQVCKNSCQGKQELILVVEKNKIIYGCIMLDDESICILGPYVTQKLTLNETKDYMNRHGINASKFEIPVRCEEKIWSSLRVVAPLLNGREYAKHEIIEYEYGESFDNKAVESDLLDYRLDNSEYDRMRFGFN